jgi:ribosome biogenesis GTPase
MSAEMWEGIVHRVRPGRILVDTGTALLEANVRGALKAGDRRSAHVVAVGDRVLVRTAERGGAVLEEVLVRRNRISRADPGDSRIELTLAANVDRLVIVVSIEAPPLNPRALDRFLVLGESAGIPCLIVLNKIDLVRGGRPDPAPTIVYASLGYAVHRVSALTGEGCMRLRGELAGRIDLLCGPSGVGKSTLLNALVPGAAQRTRPIARSTGKGVHATTRVDWIALPDGGAILDSPGIRSIRPWSVTAANLACWFPELRGHPPCRFPDCRHRAEPGCSIRAAVGEGISRARYDSYLRMLGTLEE